MKLRKVIYFLIILIVVSSFGALGAWYYSSRHDSSQPSGGPAPAATAPSTKPAPAPTPATYPVSVFFSMHPQSDNDPGLTFPVKRTSPDLGVAGFATKQLLLGPSVAEADQGYFATAKLRSGASSCGGADFTLTISGGVAKLQFCKPFDHLGVVADGQAESELKATLKQFGSVNKVIILNAKGDCEFNLSGLNLCLQ